MKQNSIETLKRWKRKVNHKPMILRGARQVGKTWLMKEFGATEYKNVVYVNFENNPIMGELFSIDMDIPRILEGLKLETSQKIKPKETLIIFDKIQEWPNAWDNVTGSLLPKNNCFRALMRYLQDIYLDFNVAVPTIEDFSKSFEKFEIVDEDCDSNKQNFPSGNGGMSKFYKYLSGQISYNDLKMN